MFAILKPMYILYHRIMKMTELQNKKSYHTIIETKTGIYLVSFYDALGCIRTVAQVLEWGAKPNFFNSL